METVSLTAQQYKTLLDWAKLDKREQKGLIFGTTTENKMVVRGMELYSSDKLAKYRTAKVMEENKLAILKEIIKNSSGNNAHIIIHSHPYNEDGGSGPSVADAKSAVEWAEIIKKVKAVNPAKLNFDICMGIIAHKEMSFWVENQGVIRQLGIEVDGVKIEQVNFVEEAQKQYLEKKKNSGLLKRVDNWFGEKARSSAYRGQKYER